MTQLNNYMLLFPSDALAKLSATKEQYTQVEMREILYIALPEAYRKKLFGVNWNTYEQTFLETINTLLRFEPEIKTEAAKAKSDCELANKVNGKGTKRYGNGTPKVLDADKTTCKTCGKQHKGKCWAKKGGNNGRNNRNGKLPFKKNQKKYINQIFKAHVAKAEESDSKSASSMADWKKGVNSC